MPRVIRSVFGSILSLPLTVGLVTAQVRDPEPRQYQFVSDVGGATALWVNPGALAFQRQLDVVGHVTWNRPEEGDWSAGQYLLGLHVKVLGLGYRHDEFAPPRSVAQGDAYTLALGYASEGTGIGVSRTWHRGGDPHDGSWELGLAYQAGPQVSVGLVWRDLGDPAARDTVRPERLVGALTFRPTGTNLSISAQADFLTGPDDFRDFRIGGTFRLLPTLQALAVAAWDGDGDFHGIWFGGRVVFGSAVGVGVAGLDSGGDARTANLGVRLIDRRGRGPGR